MQIGELARRAGVSVDTVRFYERRGVLPQPERTPSGYRIYDESMLDRLGLARALQGLGFTLAEVVDALHSHDTGGATCGSERWRVESVLARIEAKLAELETVRAEIHAVLGECEEDRCRLALRTW